MSKAERIILWVVWALVAVFGLVIPLVWFGYLTFGRGGTTNVAVVVTPTEVAFLGLMAACVISLAVWTIRRTRKKPS